jgi:hypothetical protein
MDKEPAAERSEGEVAELKPPADEAGVPTKRVFIGEDGNPRPTLHGIFLNPNDSPEDIVAALHKLAADVEREGD